MDNIQNLVDSVDAVLRSPREQAEMEADAQKLLHDFIAELKVTLGQSRPLLRQRDPARQLDQFL